MYDQSSLPPYAVTAPTVSWYTRPTAILIFVVLLCVLFFVPAAEYRPAVFLAAFNFAIICFTCARLVKQRKLSSLVPVLFCAWVALGWPLATVVFGLIYPDMHYDLPGGRRYSLDGNLRLQTVTLAFVVTYLSVFFLLRPRGNRDLPLAAPVGEARRLMSVIVPICLTITVMLAVVTVMGIEGPVAYLTQGTDKYLIGLYLVVGGCILLLKWPTRMLVLSVLGVAGFILLIGNARGLAVRPIVMLITGVLFLSAIKDRNKTIMLATVAIGFPILLVIGNTTRTLLGDIGFEDFSYRLNALGEWQHVLGESSVLLSTFGRLFSTGGHAIIVNTPERVPFMAFEPGRYGLEVISGLFVPRRFWTFTPYSDTMILNGYGFRIIPGEHSVELSMIGSFWMIGGYIATILGAIATGLVHVAVAHWVDAASRRSPLKGAVYLAGVGMSLLWATNLAFPHHLKNLVWAGAFVVVLYHLILKPFSGAESTAHGPTTAGYLPAYRFNY